MLKIRVSPSGAAMLISLISSASACCDGWKPKSDRWLFSAGALALLPLLPGALRKLISLVKPKLKLSRAYLETTSARPSGTVILLDFLPLLESLL